MNDSEARGRCRRRSAKEWSEILQGWRQSGFSAGEYAKRVGVGVGGLYRWSARLGVSNAGRNHGVVDEQVGAAQRAASRFVAVQVARGKAEPRQAALGTGGGEMEISWPGGPRVRWRGEVSASTMTALLRTMAEVLPC
jgi:hypothetical protein